jgi:heavy metal translocating P-type ATPase
MTWLRERREILEFATGLLLLALGVGAFVLGSDDVAAGFWVVATVLGLVLSGASMWSALRRRQPSVDVIALLALVGALAVGEPFAGAVITVMLTTGVLLEARAAARARRELSLLVARTPRTARRHQGDELVEVPVGDVVRGDRLLVGSGEVVPVDGRLSSVAVLDESALTGEPLPVERPAGDDVRSGVLNAGTPIELVATAPSSESTYAGVLRLVEQAQASSAPFVRAADRIAIYFVPFTLVLAGLAWLVSGDPVRAVAVLVVATPCPLLLAAPIAIMSGLSRASKIGVIIKGGGALERLAAGRVLLFDKTGTLTHGKPVLASVIAPAGIGSDELLGLAASLDQVSPHVLATSIVTAARARGLDITLPEDVVEHHGYGLEGRVGGRLVRLGKADWIVPGAAPAWVRHARRRASLDGSMTVFASVDGQPAGVLLLEDPIRADAPRMLRDLRAAGITRTVLVTGDRADVAETVGRIVGVDAVQADRDPADKVAVVADEARNGPTIMVGDGVNDAPALATAGVGVALAARGATASSETADVVLTVDRIGALADAILVARRARRIAMQAAGVGMGLSLVAMIAAALGLLPPAAGALVQEVIDVLAIAVALRAVLAPRLRAAVMPPADVALLQRLHVEHCAVRPIIDQARVVADAITLDGKPLVAVHDLLHRLQSETLPHERAEQELLYPAVARALGGADPTGTLSRSHAEIEHQVGRLARMLDELDGEVADAEDIVELRGLLYGLYAILRLHDAQEEEGAFSLVHEPVAPQAVSA